MLWIRGVLTPHPKPECRVLDPNPKSHFKLNFWHTWLGLSTILDPCRTWIPKCSAYRHIISTWTLRIWAEGDWPQEKKTKEWKIDISTKGRKSCACGYHSLVLVLVRRSQRFLNASCEQVQMKSFCHRNAEFDDKLRLDSHKQISLIKACVKAILPSYSKELSSRWIDETGKGPSCCLNAVEKLKWQIEHQQKCRFHFLNYFDLSSIFHKKPFTWTFGLYRMIPLGSGHQSIVVALRGDASVVFKLKAQKISFVAFSQFGGMKWSPHKTRRTNFCKTRKKFDLQTRWTTISSGQQN